MKKLIAVVFIFAAFGSNAQVTKRRDSLKVEIPRDKNFNPSNSKLRNSKIKTPVYNSNLTGTNAPGDVNTGIPSNNINDRPTPNAALEKLKDSTGPRN